MTIILSDLHLGHVCAKLESAQGLKSLFERADHVVLNGDSIEERCGGEDSHRHLNDLYTLADSCGVTLRILTGNHDPQISSEHSLDFFDGELLVMHGDAVFPGISPWGKEASRIAHKHLSDVREAEAARSITLQERLEIARNASLHMPVQRWMSGKRRGTLLTLLRRLIVPYKAWGIIKCWWEAASLTERFCSHYAPKAKLVVVGHTHRRGIWQRKNLTIVNLGGYLPGSEAYAVVIDDSRILVHHVQVREGRCHLGGVSADLTSAVAPR